LQESSIYRNLSHGSTDGKNFLDIKLVSKYLCCSRLLPEL